MPAIDLHRLGEERSIAMHRPIARRLPSEPALLASPFAGALEPRERWRIRREVTEALK